MHARALTLNDAFSLVRLRKPDVSPNFNFMEQLHSFEGQLAKMNPHRRPAAPLSADSHRLLANKMDFSSTSSSSGANSARPPGGGGSKYSCACLEVECKCISMMLHMQHNPQYQHVLQQSSGGGGSSSGGGGGIGVSPDSGIEFDRWTPSSTAASSAAADGGTTTPK